ncbi:ATP:Cob(I)alamin adenosyltransferase (EC [Olavius sp. associated proteobacterium Delta 1]|nr:ATP:Cob(I)alamin adenosyltransferase (EC [Olavius sp. associated proteobacterium Delta 1]
MKIYTGTGDRGKTSLFSGERVTKSDRRIEAYGDVDELNSLLGALVAGLAQKNSDLADRLHQIQADLFQLSSILAVTPDSPAMNSLEELTDRQITELEQTIDQLDGQLPNLSGFILPGGHPTAAWAHICRTVCRRAERKVTRISDDYVEGKAARQFQLSLVYLNRLSDYLFVLARHCNHIQGVSDTLWKQK